MSQNSPFANALAKHTHAPKPKTEAKITVTNISTPPPERRLASVRLLVKDGKVFIQSNGKSESGLKVTVEPIYECPLEVAAITGVVTQVAHTKYRVLSQEEVDHLLDPKNLKSSPILKATHSKSWRDLDRSAAFYSIQTIESETKWVVFFHNPTKKTAYISRKFPISKPLMELVKIILEDVKKYPHVLGKDVSASAS